MVVFRDATAVTNKGPIPEGQSIEKNIIWIQYMADSVPSIAQPLYPAETSVIILISINNKHITHQYL